MTPHSQRQQLQNEAGYFSRIYVGQISKVDEDNGIIHAVCPQISQVVPVNVPITASIKSFGSSWQRYMPREHDFVLIGFGPDNTPEILSYAVWGDQPSSAGEGVSIDRKGGYARLARLYERSKKGEPGTVVTENDDGTTTTTTQPIGLTDFIPLKGGEWDMRSAGGAYIHGDRFGVLTLAGGATSLKVNKQRFEVQGSTGLYALSSEKSYLHFGDVKRKLTPLSFSSSKPADAILPSAVVGQPRKELRLHIAGSVGGLVELPVYDLHLGDIRAADTGPGAALFSPGVVPAMQTRKKETIFDVTGATEVYALKVDNGGNWTLDTPLALTQSYSAPLATLEAQVLGLNVSALDSMALSAVAGSMSQTAGTTWSANAVVGDASMTSGPVATATVMGGTSARMDSAVPAPAGKVYLGGSLAVHPVAHGDLVYAQIAAINTALLALAGVMATAEATDPVKGPAWTALATALAVVTAALIVPPGPAGLVSNKVFTE